MKHTRVKTLILLVFITAFMAACLPSQQTGTSYSRTEARVVQTVKLGTVIDATPVSIEVLKAVLVASLAVPWAAWQGLLSMMALAVK